MKIDNNNVDIKNSLGKSFTELHQLHKKSTDKETSKDLSDILTAMNDLHIKLSK